MSDGTKMQLTALYLSLFVKIVFSQTQEPCYFEVL
jgi:hypothetical protein